MAPPPSTIKKQRSDDRQIVREVQDSRRKNSIQAREKERVAALAYHKEKQMKQKEATSSKYPRADVEHLKQIFDAYDVDGSGYIEKAELVLALQKQKEQAQRFDGKKKTLEQRQQASGKGQGQGHHKQGVFLVDFSESMFKTMDTNADGKVEFCELLRLLYPFASEGELLTMLGWTSKEPAALTLEEFELSDENRREIRSMFVLYDKDRSGAISRAEFRQAMRRCGLGTAETDEIFAEADANGDDSMDLAEFTELMRKTLFGGDVLTSAMLYAPI